MGDGAAGASVGDPAPGEPAISLDAYGEAKGIWQAADEADRTQRLRGAHETLREVSPTGRWADEILADARKAEVRLEEKLSEIYARPERARARFDRLAENEGFRDALEKVYEDPGALGRLNGHKNFLGWTDEAYDQAAGAAETLHRYGGNHLAHLAAKKHLLEAQAKIAAFEERQLDYFGDLSEVKAKLGEVYRDPEAVLTRLQEATPRRENGRIRLEGSLAANPEGRPADTDLIEVMKRDPAALGQLKGGRAGWVEDADQERALAAIPAAAEAVRHEATRRHEMNRAHRATEGAAGLLDEYRAELTRIESKVSALPPQDHMDLKARQYASDLSPEGSRVAAEQARRIETAAARVGQAAKALGAARGEAVAESRNVDAVFARLYQKPGQARANFESAAGLDPSQPAYIDAAVHLRKDPEQFGALRDDLSRGDVKTFAKEAAGAHERYAGRAMGAARARGDLQQAQRQMNITIQGIPGVRQDVQQGQGRPGMSGAGYVAGMVGRKAGRELRKAAGLDRDI